MIKHNRLNNVLIMLAIASGIYQCAENPPTVYDGNGRLELVALWDSSSSETIETFVPMSYAKVIVSSLYGIMVRETDDQGKLILSNLPSATYGISVRKFHPLDPNIMIVGTIREIEVISFSTLCDTVFGKSISSSGIAINEIYTVGPVNSFFFYFDQFYELYNASDSIRYLDGIWIMRFSGNSDGKGPGADEHDDGDIDGVVYAFKFPGYPGEQNYPIHPKQFIVIASDAVNHRTVVSTSIDLSNADWECYNQYSAEDIDNPRVPNLLNVLPHRTQDFRLALVADVFVISSGKDSTWADGIDIGTIIDGMEFQSMPHPQSKKTLDSRIDRGYVLSPPRYSGRSLQRREPGVDTNDSSADFEIISAPTPGRQ